MPVLHFADMEPRPRGFPNQVTSGNIREYVIAVGHAPRHKGESHEKPGIFLPSG